MDNLPVMPPDLRPMVQLEGGRFATSDLNDLYRRVVNRNNRLKRLIDIGAPEMIVRNEKRMLQEAVDVLIANGKRGRAVTGTNGRPLKSLGNIIEGKQGRFRQNLLGKRVDYSGRSVIVVGPHLKFNQCGLPKEMALELFKPFIIRKLVEQGFVTNVKAAKRKIEMKDVAVWDVLEEIIKDQPVMLNRAPTLHRLGIQAFDPILVEGSAIQVHPLVCTAFNADFDGDQMAVHIPLSLEAQAECRLLIMATNNILSPSNGRSIVTPSQDMVLGIYYLTVTDSSIDTKHLKYFRNVDEVIRAYDSKHIKLHTPIMFRKNKIRYETTVGRVLFNKAIWDVFREFDFNSPEFINYVVGKKQLSNLINDWYEVYGTDIAGHLANCLKDIGFKYATISGISISVDDLKVPKDKTEMLEGAEKEVQNIDVLIKDKKISEEEALLRKNDVWRRVSFRISELMEKNFGELNNVFIMANSGARGNIDQVRQLAGMRGLMSDAQGNTVKVPIKSNFKQGLSIVEYFISCYGARKGLVDTALRTADSGYLTRRLVDVAQEVTICSEDCGTKEFVVATAIKDGVDTLIPLSEVIESRYAAKDIVSPKSKEILIKKGSIISAVQAKEIELAGILEVPVRSPNVCKVLRGVCQKCYGSDLSTGKEVNIGEAIGIIAAQSIGEPGTQLTMRTFHTGGVDLRKASTITVKAPFDCIIDVNKQFKMAKIKTEGLQKWVCVESSNIICESADGKKEFLTVPSGATLHFPSTKSIKSGDVIFEYDPFYTYTISHSDGQVHFIDLEIDNRGKEGQFSKTNGEIFISDSDKEYSIELTKNQAESIVCFRRMPCGVDFSSSIFFDKPTYVTKLEDLGKKVKVSYKHGIAYGILKGAQLFVSDKGEIANQEIIAVASASSEEASKTSDIVSGLPRVEELFEARKFKNNSILSEIEGIVDVYHKGQTKIIVVVGEDKKKKEYKISDATSVLVYSGQHVLPGDKLTAGTINPHDLLETKGVEEVQQYLLEEVQKVYRSQGVSIHCKHIEIIVKQMTKRVTILEMGESELLPNEIIDFRDLAKVVEELKEQKKELPTYKYILQGMTRASITTDSILAAASFQETQKVLARAAIHGEVDYLKGLKERIIIGSLINAGTGFEDKKTELVLRKEDGSIASVSEEDKLQFLGS